MKTFQIDLFDEEKLENKVAKLQEEKENTKSRQELFVLYYLKNKCKNATQSAIEAGYSEKTAKTQASRLLKNKQVKILLEEQKKRIKTTLEIDADYIVKETLEMLQYAKGEKARISEMMQTEKIDGINYNTKVTTYLKNYSESGHKAGIEILGKMTGSFTETQKLEHSFDMEELKDENLENLLENI